MRCHDAVRRLPALSNHDVADDCLRNPAVGLGSEASDQRVHAERLGSRGRGVGRAG